MAWTRGSTSCYWEPKIKGGVRKYVAQQLETEKKHMKKLVFLPSDHIMIHSTNKTLVSYKKLKTDKWLQLKTLKINC
jgi:hypothetical protein